ncbi:MAG: tetratricopeptide repeat protein [Hyphomicrobiales bacterium]
MFGLARAQLGAGDGPGAQATLERLRDAHPKLQNQEAHLLYARTLEAQDRFAEAEEEYESLSGYYAGLEARTRYGLLLLRRGEIERARKLFEDVVKAASARRVIVTESDRDWLNVAKANL